MEDEDIAPCKYIQLIHSVLAESGENTQYSSLVYRPDFLPIPTGSALCIWRNSLVFHFASYSIYDLFFYGFNHLLQVACKECGWMFDNINFLKLHKVRLYIKSICQEVFDF